jgi:arsenate reductase-like glutaredoxin family protein
MVTLWFNENCSKSQKAKEILSDNNIKFTLKNYLTDEITYKEISFIFKHFVGDLSLLIRTDSGLTLNQINQLSIIEMMQYILDTPLALQRPLIVTTNKVYIARADEVIKDIIKDI